jgi:hypothetical protein
LVKVVPPLVRAGGLLIEGDGWLLSELEEFGEYRLDGWARIGAVVARLRAPRVSVAVAVAGRRALLPSAFVLDPAGNRIEAVFHRAPLQVRDHPVGDVPVRTELPRDDAVE